MPKAPIIWENCIRGDGSYDLKVAARHTGCLITEKMDNYFDFVESIRPVTSRQIASLTIATAFALYESDAASSALESLAGDPEDWDRNNQKWRDEGL